MSDPMLAIELREVFKRTHPEPMDRHTYFSTKVTLQTELTKLQDWVETCGEKVVVIFEGRDPARKLTA